MENKEEKEQQRQQSGFVIKIPSHQEILETSQSKTNPPSLFKPSPSFTQSFNFIKSSEFYAPPPPPPSLSSSSFSQPHTVPLPSAVAGSSSSSSSSTQSAPNRNAILVSHRCVDVMHSQHAKKLQEHRAHNRFGKNISQSETDSQTESLASPQCFHPTSPLRRTCPAQHALFYPVGQIKGNPLLKYIWNVRWAFADIICDYLLGQNSCALYLSLRYHLLHPDYLYYRIRELQKKFKLCVVLCHVDVEDVVKPLLEVTKTALLHDCTLLCGWSLEECGRYLETIKVYENKPADIIQGQMYTDYLSRLTHALTTVRHVNNTDVVTLGSTFGTLSHIMDASMEDLARCPGIGERKVKHLYDTFHEPFKHVMPKHPSATEGDPSTVSEGKKDEKEVECANKRNKKEPELTVKSALSAAFARYKEKVGEKNSKPLGVKGPEESAPGEANTAD